MVVGDDYDILRTDARRGRLDGRSNTVYACWAWLPLTDGWPPRIIGNIEQDERWRRTDTSSVLILPPDAINDLWLKTAGPRFGEVWKLKPHVLAGAAGPYPSLRAERSLMATLNQLRLEDIVYYWPACRLPSTPKHGGIYQRLATDQELAAAWAQHYRQNFDVTRPPTPE